MKEKFEIGDPVEVIDAGLIMLQKFMPKTAFPNTYGRVSEIWEKEEQILVEFPLRGGNNKLGYEHSQVAPYSINAVRKRELYKKL